MTAVDSITHIELTEDLVELCNQADTLLKSAPSQRLLNPQLHSSKLSTYKSIISSLSDLNSSFIKLSSAQHSLLSTLTTLSSTIMTLNSSISSFSPYSEKKYVQIKHSVISTLLSTISPASNLSLNDLVELFNNLEQIKHIFTDMQINDNIKDQIKSANAIILNQITQKTLQEILLIDSSSESVTSHLHYLLGIIRNDDEKNFQNILRVFIVNRKKFAYDARRDSCGVACEVRRLKDRAEKEWEICEKMMVERPGVIIEEIMKEPCKRVMAIVVGSSSVGDAILVLEELKVEWKVLGQWKKILQKECEKRVAEFAREVVTAASELSGIRFVRMPYYLRLKLAELSQAIEGISSENLLVYKEIIFDEIIGKVLAYFYDLGDLASCILSLNVYEYVDKLFYNKDYIDFQKPLNHIKEKIVELETNCLYNRFFKLGEDFSLGFMNFYHYIINGLYSDLTVFLDNKELLKNLQLKIFLRVLSRCESKLAFFSPLLRTEKLLKAIIK